MRIHCDYLIIGSGIAGLNFARCAAATGKRIVILTKGCAGASASTEAQGGVATVMNSDDSFAAHIADTLQAGRGLCHPDVVQMCVEEGPQQIRELTQIGTQFTMNKNDPSAFDLAREGGHSARRIIHAADATGKELIRALLAHVHGLPNVTLYEHHMAVNLIVPQAASPERVCKGVYALNRTTGEIRTFVAPVTVVATGGLGKVYLYTSNPDIATGDGVAMGYRAGAQVANMEFYQFHPTILYHPEAKSVLISEAVRGEGAILRDLSGEAFMAQYDPLKELAPRDMVARAIDDVLKRTGDDHVLLDITHRSPAFIQEHFPNIHATCLRFGIDMTRTPIPVVPGAHYACGGLVTDLDGHTTIPGLYAVGEVACTGLHGANRLASNSLLEGLVFSQRAARASAELPALSLDDVQDWEVGDAVPSDESVVVSQDWDELRRFMWNFVGIVRSDKRLQRARRRLDLLREEIKEYYWQYVVTPDLIELRNIATVAHLIIECAMRRKESRGLHYTADYPNESADFVRDTVVARYGQP
ncbi:MAG: L-aspartate oxidase [Proteobacteria bacterium]|nr:L-aspartate oxidase [Pseudomonadota bacterium]